MTDTEAQNRLRIDTQPLVYKFWKLQISHDHPDSNHPDDYKDVVNVYWNYHYIGSKSPGGIVIKIGKRRLIRWNIEGKHKWQIQ